MTRRTLAVVALVVLAAATSVIVLWPRGRVMPASVWEVLATPTMTPGIPHAVPTFSSFPRPRIAPAGAEADEMNASWYVEAGDGRVAICVCEDETWADDLRLWLRGSCAYTHVGSYLPTDETRDVEGQTWRRFEWKPD